MCHLPSSRWKHHLPRPQHRPSFVQELEFLLGLVKSERGQGACSGLRMPLLQPRQFFSAPIIIQPPKRSCNVTHSPWFVQRNNFLNFLCLIQPKYGQQRKPLRKDLFYLIYVISTTEESPQFGRGPHGEWIKGEKGNERGNKSWLTWGCGVLCCEAKTRVLTSWCVATCFKNAPSFHTKKFSTSGWEYTSRVMNVTSGLVGELKLDLHQYRYDQSAADTCGSLTSDLWLCERANDTCENMQNACKIISVHCDTQSVRRSLKRPILGHWPPRCCLLCKQARLILKSVGRNVFSCRGVLMMWTTTTDWCCVACLCVTWIREASQWRHGYPSIWTS